MGLSSSKGHPKVTKVAPVPARGDVPALAALHRLPSVPGQPSPHIPPAGAPWGEPIFYLELPPLRETWYGRASAGEGVTAGMPWARGVTGAVGLLADVWGGCGGVLFCILSFLPFLPFPGGFSFGKTHFPPSTALESVSLSRAQIPAPCSLISHPLETAQLPSITLAPTCVQTSPCPATL